MSGKCVNFIINSNADLDSIFSKCNAGSDYKLSICKKSVTHVHNNEVQLLYANSYCYSDWFVGTGVIGGASEYNFDLELFAKKDRKVWVDYEMYKREGWSQAKLERWLTQKGLKESVLSPDPYKMDVERLNQFKNLMLEILSFPSVNKLGVVWSSGVYAKVRERVQVKSEEISIQRLYDLREEVLLMILNGAAK